MARKGPVTRNASTAAAGLAKILVGPSAANKANTAQVLNTTTASIGALANTRFRGNTDWLKLESGFPLMEDYAIPIRESAALECSFKEITAYNMNLAYGLDPAAYTSTTSGEVLLGSRSAPVYVRMEAIYTYPDLHTMTMIFPVAQVTSAIEMDLPQEDWAAVPITFESKNASSDNTTNGHAVWDSCPLGVIRWAAAP